ncbi:hypothetical protein E2562_014177 [Oryza meyeriana var. granulata]|uniref:Uncharacterized protein n=1 Tax=Oryza meyeriana var. granulata TaxID=110450 RepID=A0A6G1BLP9_9ORYZ|nr:hypothetical protein E2562_014177 [Oryza meyeriana var. granulata]
MGTYMLPIFFPGYPRAVLDKTEALCKGPDQVFDYQMTHEFTYPATLVSRHGTTTASALGLRELAASPSAVAPMLNSSKCQVRSGGSA